MIETQTQPKLADLLAEYKCILDRKDELTTQMSGIHAAASDLEHRIMQAMEANGQDNDGDKVTANNITVTVKQKWRAKYLPERWADVVKWAVDNGYDHIVQRRLSDGKVMELVDNGVTLPDGLTVEPYKDIDFRRSK